jgi:hypothetical protein
LAEKPEESDHISVTPISVTPQEGARICSK